VTRSLLPGYSHHNNTKSISNHKQSGIDFVLTIVGDGKKYASMARFSKKFKIADQVVFTGRVFKCNYPYCSEFKFLSKYANNRRYQPHYLKPWHNTYPIRN
jgi:hypothetical protein